MNRRIQIDWQSLEIRQGRHLPHWTAKHAIYHVVLRLVNSLPKSQLCAWEQERDAILDRLEQQERQASQHERQRLDFLFGNYVECWLDNGHGTCWLREPAIADLVANALVHFHAERYILHAWCVMPNHVHVVAQPLPGWEATPLANHWTSYTATEANRLLKRKGQFWQHEAYDHIIRSEREYRRQLDYVYRNPEQVGFKNWPWRWCHTRQQ